MSKDTRTQAEILNENIPKDEVSTRKGGSGVALSYVNTFYVFSQLNRILGAGNWGYGIQNLSKLFEDEAVSKDWKTKKEVKKFRVGWAATIKFHATIDGKETSFDEVGYGDGIDGNNPGKAYELAMKEAVTDAVKRAAKNLGNRMGLALYDKTQEFVSDERPATKTAAAPKSNGKAELSKKDALDFISAKSKVIVKKQLKSIDELKAILKKDFGVDTKDGLSLPQARVFVQTLDTILQ